ncbi:MAG TPA: response regulator [Tepidisphaeraceae bacterium]
MLVVEDDRVTSQALRILLSRQNCEVTLAETVSAARAVLRESQPDYLILDLMLPDGDGGEILRELRLTSSTVKVIVTTAINDQQRMADVKAMNPHKFVRKPFDVVDLLKAMGIM